MRSDPQTDIFRHDPARLAQTNRQQAETELHNPYFTHAERQKRHDHYIAEAERLENLT